ncbi:hypothetical protein QLX08_000686 [Tetragonisca angustula]|uniref:Uncharacterized protein n=1 Tax=Tetragonisca angustula TaxID=166442 RepID=A0AAW1AIR5_9HYME
MKGRGKNVTMAFEETRELFGRTLRLKSRLLEEYFVADGTSPVRASLREDPGTLSGFNGQCPLRRKFRATFPAPKFARSRRTRRRGFHSPPECRVVSLGTRE